MRKTFRMFGMALVTILMAVSFSACSSDEGEPADPANHDPELIGTWTYYDEGSDGDYQYWEKSELVLHANGYFDINQSSWDVEDGKVKYWGYGTWETENSILHLTLIKSNDPDAIGESESGRYHINGDKLIFNDITYTRK